MLRIVLAASILVPLSAGIAGAQQPPAEKIPAAEEQQAPAPQSSTPQAPVPEPVPAPVAVPAPAPAVAPEPAPAPVPAPVAAAQPDLPLPLTAVLILAGAFLAALFGMLAGAMGRRSEARARRRAVAATLATEIETRCQAFAAVPLPPNVEAGVFFVSAITSLSGIDAGFRAAQAGIHLLPERLAAHVSVHYAAVQRVADFVKGQSLAAAVRMLQANRIGGFPCPDAGTMREAHDELGAAFRGTDKLIAALRQLT